jgi:receptor expression-enhancing protein 5/6
MSAQANAQAKMNDATAKVQSHPAFLTAKDKTNYYMSQLDKEVRSPLMIITDCTWLTRPLPFKLTKYPVLNQAESRTNVPKSYLVIGGAALVFLLHSVNVLAMPVSNLVGLVIPAFLSLRAIESPGNQDDVQYLTYWIIFAFMNFLESFALTLVLYYVPWYFAIKSVLVMYLYLPQFRVSFSLSYQPRVYQFTHCLFWNRVRKSSTTPLSSLLSLVSPTTSVRSLLPSRLSPFPTSSEPTTVQSSSR